MKITKEILKIAGKQLGQTSGTKRFLEMLENARHQKGSSQSSNASESRLVYNAQEAEQGLDALKGLDQKYYDKGLKKKTLSETFAKRFGIDLKERIQKFKPLIEMKAKKYNLDPNLLAAVIRQESNFNPYAVSSCGAMGLGQLMPETARGLGVVDPFNASQNLEGCAKYLRTMLDTFHGSEHKALAAYNAGPTAVHRHGGVPPYNETRHYVTAVLSHQRFMVQNEFFTKET